MNIYRLILLILILHLDLFAEDKIEKLASEIHTINDEIIDYKGEHIVSDEKMGLVVENRKLQDQIEKKILEKDCDKKSIYPQHKREFEITAVFTAPTINKNRDSNHELLEFKDFYRSESLISEFNYYLKNYNALKASDPNNQFLIDLANNKLVGPNIAYSAQQIDKFIEALKQYQAIKFNYFQYDSKIENERIETEAYKYMMIAANKMSDRYEILNVAKDKLSFKQKIDLAASFGNSFSQNYDYDRSDNKNGKQYGIVPIDDLFTAIKTNNPAGVCRDMAAAQAQILQKLGLPQSYVLTYGSIGGMHAVVLTQDPKNPKNIIKINYDYVSESNSPNSSNLEQSGSIPDITLNYQVYSPEGKPIARLPSALGKFMERQIKMDGKMSDPFATQDFSVASVEIKGRNFTGNLLEGKFNGKHYVGISTKLNYSKGETATGDQIEGVSLTEKTQYDYKGEEISSVEVGVGVSKVTSFRKYNENNIVIRSAPVIIETQFNLNTPFLEKEKFRIRAESSLGAMGMSAASVSTTGEKGTALDGYLQTNIGVKSEYSPTKKSKIELEVAQNNYLALSDGRVYPKAASDITLNTNYVLVAGKASHEITDGVNAYLKLAVAHRPELGQLMQMQGGVQTKKLDLNTQYQQSLTSDMPIWVPGSSPNIAGELKYRPTKDLEISIKYNQDLTKSGEGKVDGKVIKKF